MASATKTVKKKALMERTISKGFHGLGRQTVFYTEVLQTGGHLFQIKIKSDSYPFQSHARIQRWDGSAWQEVFSLHPPMMKTKLGYAEDPRDRDVQVDRTELIRVALEVVKGS